MGYITGTRLFTALETHLAGSPQTGPLLPGDHITIATFVSWQAGWARLISMRIDRFPTWKRIGDTCMQTILSPAPSAQAAGARAGGLSGT